MNVASVNQPKGKAHIRYIHEKAKQIWYGLYHGDEACWVDALNKAMEQHRSYCIAVERVNRIEQVREGKRRQGDGMFWLNKTTGIWEPLI